MPVYEYRCDSCEHTLEQKQSFAEDPLKQCPKCNKNDLKRLISGGLGFSIIGGGSTLGGRYIPMDSAEQKFEARMKELNGSGEV